MKISFGKKIAGLAVAGAVIAGAGTVAWAANNGASATNSTLMSASALASAAVTPAAATQATGKAAKADKGGGLAVLRRADHGDLEIRVKGSGGNTAATWETVTFDRGKVTSVAADHITLARPDGKSTTLTINASTKYKGVTSWQQVTTSKGAVVISENGTATTIAQRKPTATPSAPAAPANGAAPAA